MIQKCLPTLKRSPECALRSTLACFIRYEGLFASLELNSLLN